MPTFEFGTQIHGMGGAYVLEIIDSNNQLFSWNKECDIPLHLFTYPRAVRL